MEAQENPYSTILNTLRGDIDGRAVAPWIIGELRSLSPIAVEIHGQVVTTGIYVNSLLLGRNCQATLSGLSGELQGAPENMTVSGGTLNGTADLDGILVLGDKVVMLQSGDGQDYVILCKVVSG